MKNPFWNGRQGRLRTLWRLVIQALLLQAGTIAFGIVFGVLLAVGRLLGRSGGGPLVPQPCFWLVDAAIAPAGIVASVWLAGRYLDHRRFADFGFHLGRRWWLDFGFGLALGAILMAGIFLVERAAGWVTVKGMLVTSAPGQSFVPAILLSLAAFLAVGIYEELWARGYQLHNLAEGLNGRTLGPRGGLLLAWAISSALFGALHAGNPNATAASTASLMLAGLFLGLGYILTGELALPIGLHIGWNLFQGNVFGFPVSGIDAGPTLIAIAQDGPALWTGGAFGPEAGLMGIGAILVGSGLIVAWLRWRDGRVGLCERLARHPSEHLAPREPGQADDAQRG